MIQLHDGDNVVTAWAEHVNGPGYRNSLVWVLIRNRVHDLRIEALQPSELTDDVWTLFNVSEAVDTAMRRAVKSAIAAEKVRLAGAAA